MNKKIFSVIAPMVLLFPILSCGQQNNDFNMNDEVCSKYLSSTTSRDQFKIIYNNIASITETAHDVAVAYQITCPSDGGNEYHFHIANNPDFKNEIVESKNSPEFDLTNLIPGEEYYWKVIGSKNDSILNSGNFKVNKDNVRWINVPSVGNFRDLGGWDLPNDKQIKFGQIYRGRNPDSISEEDKSVLLDSLGIKTQIDLRKDNDSGTPGKEDFPTDKVKYYYYNEMLAYDDVIERIKEPLRGPCKIPGSPLDGQVLTGAQMFKNIFETLANKDNYPIYFHCSAGADRTGSLAFLIEGLLGVSEEDMTRDYELTSFCSKVKGGRLRREPNEAETDFDYTKSYFCVYDQTPPNPPSITHWPLLIEETKMFGGNLSEAITNFLKIKCEVSQETLDQVKANLTI